jgi:hypothetical protein
MVEHDDVRGELVEQVEQAGRIRRAEDGVTLEPQIEQRELEGLGIVVRDEDASHQR